MCCVVGGNGLNLITSWPSFSPIDSTTDRSSSTRSGNTSISYSHDSSTIPSHIPITSRTVQPPNLLNSSMISRRISGETLLPSLSVFGTLKMQVEYIRSIVLPVVSPSIHEKSIENNSRNVLREKNLRLQYLDACIQSDNGIGGKRPYLEGIMPIRPPVKWHGGKRYLASRIIGHFPQHRVYLEPFGGGASVLLNKAPVDVETYNDLDKRITRLFRVLREHGSTFVEQARFVLYSQIEFEDAGQYPPNATELQMAICDF